MKQQNSKYTEETVSKENDIHVVIVDFGNESTTTNSYDTSHFRLHSPISCLFENKCAMYVVVFFLILVSTLCTLLLHVVAQPTLFYILKITLNHICCILYNNCHIFRDDVVFISDM